VKLTCDPAAFLILYAKQLHGKATKRRSALLYQRLQGVMGSAESIFCRSLFAQVIAHLILPAPADQCAPNGADQRYRPQGAFEQSYVSQRSTRAHG
jgi:hypothetical protein